MQSFLQKYMLTEVFGVTYRSKFNDSHVKLLDFILDFLKSYDEEYSGYIFMLKEFLQRVLTV